MDSLYVVGGRPDHWKDLESMKGETGTGDYGYRIKKTVVEYVRDDLGCWIGLAHESG